MSRMLQVRRLSKYNKLLIITICHQNTLASLDDDGVYFLDEGHHTDDGGQVMMGMGVMKIIVGNVMREAILWF